MFVIPAPGGGSQPKQETVQGTASIASGGQIPWGHDTGDTLLDYTDPNAPTVIEAGCYAIGVYVTIDPTDATAIRPILGLPAVSITNVGPVVAGVSDFGQVEVSAVAVLDAGDSFGLALFHDNTGSRDCSLAGYVVKIA